MFTVRPIFSIFCAIAFSAVLTNACEAGTWKSKQAVVSTQFADGYFEAIIVGKNYATETYISTEPFVGTGPVPNDPYPGMTTYYHVLQPVTKSGPYQAIIGNIYFEREGSDDPRVLKGQLEFELLQY
ncbi:MAG: hypothetical protein JKY95_00805 [Planctomycetaceae bacterium]|nr:hypothetical protein [Planctomycetaceae bacterium]